MHNKLKYVYVELVKRKTNPSVLDMRAGLFSGFNTNFSIDFICLREKSISGKDVCLNIDEYDIVMIEVLEDQWKNMVLFTKVEADQKKAHEMLNKTMEVLYEQGFCEINTNPESEFYNCNVDVLNYNITDIGDKFTIYNKASNNYNNSNIKLKRNSSKTLGKTNIINNTNTTSISPKVEKGPTFIKRESKVDKELITTLYNQLKAF